MPIGPIRPNIIPPSPPGPDRPKIEHEQVTAKQGDNLWKILRTNLKELKTDNQIANALVLLLKDNPDIKDPDKIKVGQKIWLPSKDQMFGVIFKGSNIGDIVKAIQGAKTIPENIKANIQAM